MKLILGLALAAFTIWSSYIFFERLTGANDLAAAWGGFTGLGEEISSRPDMWGVDHTRGSLLKVIETDCIKATAFERFAAAADENLSLIFSRVPVGKGISLDELHEIIGGPLDQDTPTVTTTCIASLASIYKNYNNVWTYALKTQPSAKASLERLSETFVSNRP